MCLIAPAILFSALLSSAAVPSFPPTLPAPARPSIAVPSRTASPPYDAANKRPAASIRLHLPAGASAVVKNIADLLARRIGERCRARVTADGQADLDLYLAVDPGIGAEGYAISDEPGGGLRIAGGDERGLLYGVGRFLRTSAFEEKGLVPGSWRGRSVPDCPLRGIYFAVHFGNFYEAAPAAEVERYIEDLALWGMNAVACNFPPQQFSGLDDPAARRSIEKIRRLFKAAKRLGLDAGLLEAANCAFTSAPETIRYTPFNDALNRRSNYGELICPSRPEGREYLLKFWEAVLDEFKNPGLDFFVSWPYDEGGCGCERCRPWGARGFLNLSRDIAGLVRKKHPGSRFVLSTWLYDTPPEGEWEGLSRALAADGSWVDAIMADAHEDFPRYPLEHPVPGGKALLNFPEISMWGQAPWGGYGANPLPARFERLWRQASGRLAGGFPYSEGIFEDINKVLCLQFYWEKSRPAMNIIREYAAAEFSPAVADDVAGAVRIFETNHLRDRIGEGAVKAAALMEGAGARLAAAVREGWRWRLIALRARIDDELRRSGGKIEGAALKRAFSELTAIYHAQNAPEHVRPPRLPPPE